MIFGLQLFGIMMTEGDNWKEALSKIKATGYDRVEPCISFFDMGPMAKSFWPVEKIYEYFSYAKALGLEIQSCHVATKNFLADAPKMAELAKKYGIKYFVTGLPKDHSETSLQAFGFVLRSAADILGEAGAEILLHNGAPDAATKIDGRTSYEYMADICLGKVGFQPDTGWLEVGGEDAKAFILRNGWRIKSLHLKDFVEPGVSEKDIYIGGGSVDNSFVVQYGRAYGIPVFIDQDHYAGFPQDAEKSLRFAASAGNARDNSVSYLNILDTETGEVKILHRFDGVVEAPNWLKKDDCLIYNAEGCIWRYDFATDTSVKIESGKCTHCNNDHVPSGDETVLAVSCAAPAGEYPDQPWTSFIYKFPMAGGTPVQITDKSPSFLHGYSPDNTELAYCAFRQIDGKRAVDVYTISADGGEEKRLTTEGFNDGPEYSPDGKHIWYISTRTGLMQVWRMNRDGSEQTQMTFEEQNNWFGHVSPDGKKVLNIVYAKDELQPSEHLSNMRVELWIMNYDGSDHHKILSFFGGQGSINVNSWAADSKRVAFVSYDVKTEI